MSLVKVAEGYGYSNCYFRPNLVALYNGGVRTVNVRARFDPGASDAQLTCQLERRNDGMIRLLHPHWHKGNIDLLSEPGVTIKAITEVHRIAE